jgi:hypothetical protein
MSSTWPSIIAVIGTLAGALTTNVMQARFSRADRREDRADARREAQLAAITQLVTALADHRLAMWVREDLRLNGADSEHVAKARTASYATRSAITAPLTAVAILVPSLTEVARAAAEATYALRGADSHADLDASRRGAMEASDRLVTAAGKAVAR